MDIVVEVRKLVEASIVEKGYILDEVLYEKEGGQYFLRIIIDSNSVINLEDCVIVSKLVNPILDDSNLIESNYILDVCSKEKGCEI